MPPKRRPPEIRYTTPARIYKRRDLPSCARMLYGAMWWHQTHFDTGQLRHSPSSFIRSYADLARDVGISVASAKRGVRALVEAGLLAKHPSPGTEDRGAQKPPCMYELPDLTGQIKRSLAIARAYERKRERERAQIHLCSIATSENEEPAKNQPLETSGKTREPVSN